MLDFAIDLAYRAGSLLRAGVENERILDAKDRFDLVSDIDHASEEFIAGAIAKRYPAHALLAEERGGRSTASGYVWVVDPVDGTLNYIHNMGMSCVSIGLIHNGQPLLGVVYDPFRNELFSAQRGQGAYCNGRRLSVSSTPQLQRALLATDFPYFSADRFEENSAIYGRVLAQTQDLRRLGSAVLAICYVAAGRLDGYWMGIKPWDIAASTLLVREAGGTMSDWQGQPYDPWAGENSQATIHKIMVTNGHIHNDLVALLQPA